MKNLLEPLRKEIAARYVAHSEHFEEQKRKFIAGCISNPAYAIEWNTDDIIIAQETFIRWSNLHVAVQSNEMTDALVEIDILSTLDAAEERLLRGHIISHSTNQIKNAMSIFEAQAVGLFIIDARKVLTKCKREVDNQRHHV